MRQIFIAILIGLFTQPSCGQPEGKSAELCGCIDYRFSSKESVPIAHSYIGKQIIAFCGYQKEYSDGEKVGILSQDSSFIGCGYEIILCSENKSIYSLGEAYNDSVKLYSNHFEVFRIELFPDKYGESYKPISLFKIEFFEDGDKIESDTSIAIPHNYLSEDFLSNIKSQADIAKADSENPTKHLDLELHYMFLRAIADKAFEEEFINSGPYDGYLAVIHTRFQDYLKMKNE